MPDIEVRETLALRKSRIHGWGVFAKTPIRKGLTVIEYKGERIDWKQASHRYPDDPKVPTYLFIVDDEIVIDGAINGGMARRINHSCDPNCQSYIEDDRVWIETIRPVSTGDELTYDYNLVLDDPHTPSNKKRYPCACGTKKCRRTILGKKR